MRRLTAKGEADPGAEFRVGQMRILLQRLQEREVKVQRDFTHVDDIVEGVIRVLDKNAAVRNREYGSNSQIRLISNAPYRVFNIGNNNPVPLLDFIGAIEKALGMTAEKRLLPLQDGDSCSRSDVSWEPRSPVPFRRSPLPMVDISDLAVVRVSEIPCSAVLVMLSQVLVLDILLPYCSVIGRLASKAWRCM